jgi:hypothetical protein
MRIKVELHSDAVWYVRHRCNREEAAAFYDGLERIRVEPITHSEPTVRPERSRYMLRFFRFRGKIAVFEYDIGRNLIRVLECETSK